MKQGYLACKKSLLLTFLLLSSLFGYGQYCVPSYSTACNTSIGNDYIQSFSTSGGITNIINNNSNCGNPGNNYSYYSNMAHTAAPGNVVNFSVTNNPSWTENFTIWVDWNQDNIFSATEQVYITSIGSSQTVNGSFIVPLNAVPGTTRMRLRNIFGSNTPYSPCNTYTYGECEDYNFIVQPNQPCSGTPAATITSSSASFCAPATVTLTGTPGVPALGYTYQWQSSPACAFNFTNIPGATNATYNITSLSASTDYRLVITCSGSGISSNSNVINIYPGCYCSSAATNTGGADIGAIQVATSGFPTYNNPATAPTSYTFNAAANNTYTNYSSQPPINLVPGTNTAFVVAQVNSGAHTSSYLKIFIDFNRDGDFLDAGETVYQGSNFANPGFVSFTGLFAVPAGVQPGNTRMRFVLRDGGNINTVSSCGGYTNGETEDYTVFINPVLTPLIASNNGPVCASNTVQLNAGTTATCASFSWSGPNGFTSTLQNPTITNVGTGAAGTYTVTVNSYGVTATANTTVTVLPSITTNATASICAGTTLTFGTQTITTAGTYTETFSSPSGCDSIVTLTVSVTSQPAMPAVNSPVVYCQGATPTALTASGTNLLWYTTPTGGTGIATAPVPSTAIAASTTYYVSQTVNGCESPRAPVVVIVNPAPAISLVNTANPTSCGGSNGSITIGGLVSGTSYTVSYSMNGAPQSVSLVANASGNIIISGLSQGSYTGISVSINGCSSNTIATVTLSDPSAPSMPVVGNNGPLCAGATLNLTATVSPGASVSWTGPNSFGSAVANPSITNVQSVNAGVYSVTATANGCSSAPATTTVIINPTPVISSTSVSNPTTCGGANGSISLNGLAPNTSYSISYSSGVTTVTAVLVSDASGTVVISNLSGGTYTNITAALGSCISSAVGPLVITTPLPPATPTVAANTPVCEGAALNLTASSVSGTYSWTGPNGFTSSAQNPVISSATVAASGVYSVTVTANGCTSLPATVSAIVNPLPVIGGIATTNPTTCNGSNGSLTLSGLQNTTSYIVNFSKNGIPQTAVTQTTGVAGSITLTNLGAGIYSNITVAANGCTSAPDGPVTISNPSGPTPPVVSNNGPLCSGATLNLSATTIPGATYSWNGPNGFSSTLQNPSIANVPISAAGVYSVVVTVANCSSQPVTTTVIVNQTPMTPVAGSNGPVCDGTDISLTAANIPGVNFSWAGPNGFSSSSQNPVITNATIANAGIYTVSSSLNGCTSPADTINVTVNPKPSMPLVSNDTFCQFSTIPQLSATGQNLLWYSSATGGTGAATAPTPSGATIGTFTWYVSQTVNGCESPRTPVSIVIIATPVLPVVTSPVVYCQNDTATALLASGSNIVWYTQPVGGIGSSTPPVPSTAVPGTFTWFASQTANGCEGARAAITVIVNATPDTPFVANPISYCQGELPSPIPVQGQNLTWYHSISGGTGSSTTPVVNTDSVGKFIYYVSQTTNGCESPRATVVITVDEKVKATISLTDNDICQYDTIMVESTELAPASASFNWNFDGATVISGNGAGPYVVRWDDPGSKIVSLAIDNFSCHSSDAQLVNVKASPGGEFAIKPDACVDEVMYVQAAWNSLDATSYSWDFADATIINGAGAGAYKITFNTPGTKVLSLNTVKDGCRSFPHLDTIVIHETPSAKIAPLANAKICRGDEVIFQSLEPADPNMSYTWQPAAFFPVNGLAQATGIVRTGGLVFLTVTDPYGCYGRDSIFIDAQSCCTVALPDAFTPNNDGRNDVFRIITDGHQQVSVFRIVNRWGQTVFQTASSDLGWDGTFHQQPQPTGTYYYYLKYQCGTEETFEKHGELTLIR